MVSEMLPKYMIIALDFAKRIYEGEITEGEKVSGRTTLAAEYNVSPETIRKSVKLLHDMKIVETLPQSGIYIKSSERAHDFILKYKDKGSVFEVKTDLKKLLKEKADLENRIQKDIAYLIDNTTRVKKVNDIVIHQTEVPPESPVIGRSLKDLAFRRETGAMVVGVSRNEVTLNAPDPDFILMEGDGLLYVGEENSVEKVRRFIYGLPWNK